MSRSYLQRARGEQGATLKLAHAIPAIKVPGAVDPEGGPFRAFLFEMAREELAKLQQQAGTTFEMLIKGGEVAHVVRNTSEDPALAWGASLQVP